MNIRLLLFTVLVSRTANLLCQETYISYWGGDRQHIRETYSYHLSGKDTIRHGSYTILYRDGTTWQEGRYMNGYMEGTWRVHGRTIMKPAT